MSRFHLKNRQAFHEQPKTKSEQELYEMTDEVNCSPEFPQGCISAE